MEGRGYDFHPLETNKTVGWINQNTGYCTYVENVEQISSASRHHRCGMLLVDPPKITDCITRARVCWREGWQITFQAVSKVEDGSNLFSETKYTCLEKQFMDKKGKINSTPRVILAVMIFHSGMTFERTTSNFASNNLTHRVILKATPSTFTQENPRQKGETMSQKTGHCLEWWNSQKQNFIVKDQITYLEVFHPYVCTSYNLEISHLHFLR